MQLEEKEAGERVSADDVVTYKKTCSEIQRLVSEANDLKIKGKQHNVSSYFNSIEFLLMRKDY